MHLPCFAKILQTKKHNAYSAYTKAMYRQVDGDDLPEKSKNIGVPRDMLRIFTTSHIVVKTIFCRRFKTTDRGLICLSLSVCVHHRPVFSSCLVCFSQFQPDQHIFCFRRPIGVHSSAYATVSSHILHTTGTFYSFLKK